MTRVTTTTALSAATAMALALGVLPAAAAPDLTPLMTPAEVSTAQGNGAIVLDIRSGEAFAKGHVPGAVNVPYGAFRGPATNPGALISDAALTKALRGAGIEDDSAVIVVNGGENPTAFGATARVYWTLKSAGLSELAVLNGGTSAWVADGLALSTEAVAVTPSEDDFAIATTWAMTRDEVRAVTEGESAALLIDARPDDFFRGATKHPAASWAGTLQGAVNLVHDTFIGLDGKMADDPAAVRAAVEASGYTRGTTVVSFCNTGHWAASNWFALSEIGGIEGVKLYPESMSGWSRMFPQG
ncbi:MAG: rhodanese-like domain-containing protein [Pseudomonadota bacterium]